MLKRIMLVLTFVAAFFVVGVGFTERADAGRRWGRPYVGYHGGGYYAPPPRAYYYGGYGGYTPYRAYYGPRYYRPYYRSYYGPSYYYGYGGPGVSVSFGY